MAYNPFEEKYIARITKNESADNPQRRALFDRSYREMANVLESARIRERDFLGMYALERIEEDLRYVKERKRDSKVEFKEEEEARKLAVISEGLFFQGGNKYGWLGDGARVIKTSEYDDWKNGVDGIIEFKGDDEKVAHTAWGVDVTYGVGGTLEKKFRIIMRNIEKGDLAFIKYFKSGDFKGERGNVPRVVVGAEKRHIMDVCACKDEAMLLRHPYQTLQLKEMQLEFEAFAAYALKKGKEGIAGVFRVEERRIRRILQEKIVKYGRIPEDLLEDKVFKAIIRELKKFHPEMLWD